MKNLNLAGTSADIAWLVECDGSRWSLTDVVYNSNSYINKIINFSGPSLYQCRPANKQIAPNKLSFDLIDTDTLYNPVTFVGSDLTLRLIIGGVEKLAWGFTVKSCVPGYKKLSFKCEDFLQQYLLNSEYPNKRLINGLDTSSAEHAGDEKACIPVVFGNPYIPLRSIWYNSERYYVLGDPTGIYTISKASFPVDWPVSAEYESPDYTFPQSTVLGLRVFQVHKDGATIGTFLKSSKLHDMPCKFSNSGSVGTTNPADMIKTVLTDSGLSISRINETAFTAAAASYTSAGITFEAGFNTRRPAIDVLCELLNACDSFLRVTDTVALVPRSSTSVITLNKDTIYEFGFSPVTLTKTYDAGTVKFYPDVQAGTGHTIDIPITGTEFNELSSDTLDIPFLTDTGLLQQLGRVYFRRQFWKTGSSTFSAVFPLLGLEVGDLVTINEPGLYQGGDVVIDSISISKNLEIKISAESYAQDIGEFLAYMPPIVTVDIDSSLYIRPDPDGKYKNYIFKRSSTVPATPTGDTPTGWTGSPPAGSGQLYMSCAFFIGEALATGEVWSAPIPLNGVDGTAGVDGSNGTDGDSVYVEYSVDGSTSWHTAFAAGDYYMRQKVGLGEWSAAIRIVGEAGVDGLDGTNGTDGVKGDSGDAGPGLIYVGIWSNTKQYYATATRRDVVQSGGNFYACKSTHLNIAVTNSTYWEIMPEFQSIATGFLLTDHATVLKNLNLGWTDSQDHIADCAIRSGMSDPDTGTGFWLGRSGGKPIASIKGGNSTGIKVDETGTTVTGKMVIGGGSTGIGNFSDASLAAIDGTANTKLGGISAGADVTKTTIDGGLITTGIIADHATTPQLKIDFTNAAITVNKASGLIINAVGGLTVNSGGSLLINNGGDLLLSSSYPNSADILFKVGSYIYATISTRFVGSAPSGLKIIPTGSNYHDLYIGDSDNKWEWASIYASQGVQLYCGNSSISTREGSIRLQNGTSYMSVSSENTHIDTGVHTTSANSVYINSSAEIIHTNGAHSVKMKDGFMIHRGNKLMYSVATYDYLIPNIGDFIIYCYANGDPQIRYRRDNGACYSRAM